MAYITTANSKRIIRKVDFTSVTFDGEVYKKPIYFFSRYEEQNLLAIKELLENPEQFSNQYYDVLVNHDSFQYVFENGKPAYHQTLNCPRLHSDFQNFEIPEEIIKRGQEEVEKYRAWFKDVAYLFESDDDTKIEIFKERCRLRFNLDLPPKVVKRNNSGSFEIENLNLDELEKKIDDLIRSAGRFYYKSEKHTTILKKFSKLTFLANKTEPLRYNETGYSDAEVKDILREHAEEFKYPLIHLLREWYRVKLNPNLEFEGKLLERLGFVSCSTCLDDNINSQHICKDNYKDAKESVWKEERIGAASPDEYSIKYHGPDKDTPYLCLRYEGERVYVQIDGDVKPNKIYELFVYTALKDDEELLIHKGDKKARAKVF